MPPARPSPAPLVSTPPAGAPGGKTDRVRGSVTSWPGVALNAAPGLAVRVVSVAVAASGTGVLAGRRSGAGAAGFGGAGFCTGGAFSGAGLAAAVGGAGTSFMAAVDSVGASVRLRAVESVDRLVCSPLTHPSNMTLARAVNSDPCLWSLII